MPTILVVDDDAHIRDVVQYALEREGFRVAACADGSAALARIAAGGVDLVVLDVLMPELDGLSLCRRIRQGSRLPIIFLSSRGEEVDRILGLELGGDDYVPKPFSPRELATRVKAVLRRAGAPSLETPAATLAHGRLEMDLPRHEVRVGTARVDLTVTEFELLRALLERPGRVLTRTQLIREAGRAMRAPGDEYHITERTIDTHIRRIRAKLRPFDIDPIETVHGLGYKASEPARAAP
jgi:two-component system OmpR family response regulator